MKALIPKRKFIVGIDGGNENGIAVYNPVQNGLTLMTLSFWDMIKRLTYIKNHCDKFGIPLLVVIEDVTQNKPVFNKLYPPKGSKMNRIAYVGKISQDIGKNKQITQCLMDFCKIYDINYHGIVPMSGNPKLSGKEIEKLTGIQKSNQHTRDAVMLLYRNGFISYD